MIYASLHQCCCTYFTDRTGSYFKTKGQNSHSTVSLVSKIRYQLSQDEAYAYTINEYLLVFEFFIVIVFNSPITPSVMLNVSWLGAAFITRKKTVNNSCNFIIFSDHKPHPLYKTHPRTLIKQVLIRKLLMFICSLAVPIE